MSRLAIAVTTSGEHRGTRWRGYVGPVRPVRVQVSDAVDNLDLPVKTEAYRLPRSWCRGDRAKRLWNHLAVGRPLVRP